MIVVISPVVDIVSEIISVATSCRNCSSIVECRYLLIAGLSSDFNYDVGGGQESSSTLSIQKCFWGLDK